MATNPIENPSVHQELQDAKRKRKQEIDKKYRERKKQKQENNEVQVKTLQGECSYYKGQADFGTKSMTKPFLDEASEIKKLVLGHGEILRHLRDNVNKETAVVYEFWDLIKKTLPGGSTCGSISASTDENGYPPLELSVIAMRSDGSMTTESFKPCQSLPEEWARLAMGERERLIRAFFGLREHYTATTARHAQERAKWDQERANLKEELDWARANHYSPSILFGEKEPPKL